MKYLILIFISFAKLSAGSWSQIYETQENAIIYDMCISNYDEIYFTYYNNTQIDGKFLWHSFLMKTNDEFNTIDTLFADYFDMMNDPFVDKFRNVIYMEPNTIIGNYQNDTAGYKLLKSTDNGKQWDVIFSGKKNDSTNYTINELYNNNGVIKFNTRFGGNTFYSFDNGDTYMHLEKPEIENYVIFDTYAFNEKRILLNVVELKNYDREKNYLLYSEDSGVTYDTLPGQPEATLDFRFLNDNVGFLLGYKDYVYDERAVIYKTIDKGKSWYKVFEEEDYYYQKPIIDMVFLEDSVIYMTSVQKVYKSTNTGDSWFEVTDELPLDDNLIIKDIVSNNSDVYIITSHEKKYKFYKYEINSSVEENYISKSNFSITPNPASDYIEISFSNKGLQPFANSEEIEIYDVLGERVYSTKDTERSRSAEVGNGGSFSGYFDYAQQPLRIDVSNLPRGVYFVRIGDKVEKFVKR